MEIYKIISKYSVKDNESGDKEGKWRTKWLLMTWVKSSLPINEWIDGIVIVDDIFFNSFR